MSKSFMAILAAVVVGLVGLFVLAGGKSESNDVSFSGDPFEVQETDHIKGENKSNVTLIEYGDFACPGCAALHPLLKQLEVDRGEDIQIIFRHFPLSTIHPNALAAHRAAEAAGNQGFFWEMHDALYEGQQGWSAATSGRNISQVGDDFRSVAEQLGLDLTRYDEDVKSEAVFNAIDLNIDSGNQIGVTGTPTLVLNGEIIPTPRTYEDFLGLIDEAIAGNEADSSEEPVENADSSEAEDSETQSNAESN